MEKSYDDNYPFKIKCESNDKLIEALKKYNHDLTLPEDLFNAINEWNRSQYALESIKETETIYNVWYNFTKEPDRYHAERFYSEIDAMAFVKKLLDDTLMGNSKYEILDTLQVELEANEYSKEPGHRFNKNIFLFDRKYGYYKVNIIFKDNSTAEKVYVNDFTTAYNYFESLILRPEAKSHYFIVTLEYAQNTRDFKVNNGSIIKSWSLPNPMQFEL